MDESLREAACQGNLHSLRKLLTSGAAVNSQNSMNGWTALHWAAKRNHVEIVKHLLQSGALPSISNHKGELPANLTTSQDILTLLTERSDDSSVKSHTQDTSFALPFVPNYLRNAPFPYYDMTSGTQNPSPQTVDTSTLQNALPDTSDNTSMKSSPAVVDCAVAKPTLTPFVVKVWIDDALLSKYNKDSVEVQVKLLSEKELEPTAPSATTAVSSSNTYYTSPFFVKARIIDPHKSLCYIPDGDFIEVVLEDNNMTYQGLVKACCNELNVSTGCVTKVRKLPNVRIRNDGDVQRLKKGQELEILVYCREVGYDEI